MYRRRLFQKSRSFYLNIPMKIVEAMNAKPGDTFEIYAGEGGVFTVGLSNTSDTIPDPGGANTNTASTTSSRRPKSSAHTS